MIGPDCGGVAPDCLLTPNRAPRPRLGHHPRADPESRLERLPAPRGRAGRVTAGSGSVPSVDLDLAGLGQHVDDVGLEVGVMHARLPELARVPVILPVVVPVAPAVGPEPVHVHLRGRAARVTPSRGPGSRGRGRASGRGAVREERGAATSRPQPEAGSSSIYSARLDRGHPALTLRTLSQRETAAPFRFSFQPPSDYIKNTSVWG